MTYNLDYLSLDLLISKIMTAINASTVKPVSVAAIQPYIKNKYEHGY
jgi:hypothetical protein